MPPIFASFSSSIKSYGLVRATARSVLNRITQGFNFSTTWIVPTGVTSIDYLVVAGGGGGGVTYGGGGGAGGYRTGKIGRAHV